MQFLLIHPKDYNLLGGRRGETGRGAEKNVELNKKINKKCKNIKTNKKTKKRKKRTDYGRLASLKW